MATRRTRKVGILVECGRRGLEDVLCHRICDLLREQTGVDFEIETVPMDSKRNLILNCGAVTATLLSTGFHRVVILWDERPAWPRAGEQLCWHNDRMDILANLRQARVADGPVHLVCIEREFESWLLFDHKLVSSVLSTAEHPVRVGPQRSPDRMSNPKGAINNLFLRYRHRRYADIQDAANFARRMRDLTQLRRCATFRRFAERVTGRAD